MKIELKNIQYNDAMSEETSCYSASLYVDGTKIGIVSNHGHGGCDDFQGDRAAFERANAWCIANLPKWPGIGGELLDTDLEIHCGDLLNEYIERRDFKRLIRSHAVFKASDSRIYQTKYGGKRKPDPELFEYVQAKNPGAVVLNTLPENEAFAIFKEHV